MLRYYDFANMANLTEYNLTYVNDVVLSSESRRSGKSVYLTTQLYSVTFDLYPNYSTIYFGVALKINCASGSSSASLIRFNDIVNFATLVGLGASNKLFVTVRSTTLSTIGTIPLIPYKWCYLEGKITFSSSIAANDFVIKLNGVEALNLPAGTETRPWTTNDICNIVIYGPSLTEGLYFEDFYVNTTGFLGDVTAKTYYPSGNGDSSQFVGSDSDSIDNYALIDETTPGVSDYVQSDTIGNKDLYVFEDSLASTIHCVKVNSVWSKNNTLFRSVKNQIKSGGTIYEGAEQFLGYSSTTYSPEYLLTDPNTSLQWTPANFNAAQFGVKVHS